MFDFAFPAKILDFSQAGLTAFVESMISVAFFSSESLMVTEGISSTIAELQTVVELIF